MAKKTNSNVRKDLGRWATVGMTPATEAWKFENNLDQYLIYLLDTATGEVHVRGDVSDVQSARGNVAASMRVSPDKPQKSARKNR